MEQRLKNIVLSQITNWRTSLFGLLIIIFTVFLGVNIIDTKEYIQILGFITSMGLISSRDGIRRSKK